METDFHANHRHGLCNPETKMSDGEDGEYKPELTETQKYLWELRTKNIGHLTNFLGRDPLVYINKGDQTNGTKHEGNWVSTNIANQYRIARANVAPIFRLKNLKIARFIRGTQSHEFGNGAAAQSLQDSYEETYPKIDVKTFWHPLVSINGFEIDISHHGPGPGSRTWLRGNMARYYLRDRMFDDLVNGKTPPKVYARAHYHHRIWETLHHPLDNGWVTSSLILTPSMCGLGAYARQVTKSMPRVTNGMVCLRVENRKLLEVEWFTQTLDIRTREILNV